MGLGDDIIVTRQARILYEQTKKQVVPTLNGKANRWSLIYDNNPILSKSITRNTINLEIRPRPYLEYHNKEAGRFIFRPNNLGPGEIYLTDSEISHAKKLIGHDQPFIYIEPNIKGKVSSTNKDWGFEKYQQVVDQLHSNSIRFIQCGAPNTRYLENVQQIKTVSIREALSVLKLSMLYLGNEGCMHHAAAAFNISGVVIFGGYISPECTGYDLHKNLYIKSDQYPYGCGTLGNSCEHCRQAMGQISVDQTINEIKILL